MIASVIDVPEALHRHRERGRAAAGPRWVRCVRDQWLHRLDAGGAAVQSGERAVCGRVISPAPHTLSSESLGLCEDRVAVGCAS